MRYLAVLYSHHNMAVLMSVLVKILSLIHTESLMSLLLIVNQYLTFNRVNMRQTLIQEP